MKRKFQATVTYDIVIDDPQAELSDRDATSVTGLHIMSCVYAAQVGDLQGFTECKPSLGYDAEEVSMSWKETT